MLKDYFYRVIDWFASFFRPSPDDVYHPRERLIYRYWTGKEEKSGDPMTIYKRMMEVGPALSIDIKVATSPSKDAKKAHDGMMTHIRNIFGVSSLEDGGLSEIETAQLLDHFLRYCERIKKKQSGSATISTPSVDSIPISEAKSPVTAPPLDSGSTVSETSTDVLGSSPTG